uniref:Uncharacterized protein n=1 Tax=Magallana gigas TaxID=29159 RepID=K1Q6I9_MAGGI
MDTMFDLTEQQKKIRTEFYSPKTYSMAEASSLPSCTRLCLGPVQVKSTYESAQLMEHFEGVVQSVSFTSNLIEIQDHMFTISKNNLAKIFPEGKFKFVEMLEVTAKGHFWQEVRAYVKDVLLPYHEKTTLNHQPSQSANRMLKELGGLCQHDSVLLDKARAATALNLSVPDVIAILKKHAWGRDYQIREDYWESEESGKNPHGCSI